MENAKGELVPGGLAMVYGLVIDTDHNGKIVTLVETLAERTPDYEELWPGKFDGCAWHVVDGGESTLHPRNLMPINPSADPLHTEQDQCMTA
jgi:hypothetical protein